MSLMDMTAQDIQIEGLKEEIKELRELTASLMERIIDTQFKCIKASLEISKPEDFLVYENRRPVWNTCDKNIEWEGYRPYYLDLPLTGHFEIYAVMMSYQLRVYIEKTDENEIGNVIVLSQSIDNTWRMNVRWLRNKRPAVYISGGGERPTGTICEVEIMYKSL